MSQQFSGQPGNYGAPQQPPPGYVAPQQMPSAPGYPPNYGWGPQPPMQPPFYQPSPPPRPWQATTIASLGIVCGVAGVLMSLLFVLILVFLAMTGEIMGVAEWYGSSPITEASVTLLGLALLIPTLVVVAVTVGMLVGSAGFLKGKRLAILLTSAATQLVLTLILLMARPDFALDPITTSIILIGVVMPIVMIVLSFTPEARSWSAINRA